MQVQVDLRQRHHRLLTGVDLADIAQLQER
jgi:hypothetical protein